MIEIDSMQWKDLWREPLWGHEYYIRPFGNPYTVVIIPAGADICFTTEISSSVAKYDVGYIDTTPSDEVPGANNCFQYDVSGHGTRKYLPRGIKKNQETNTTFRLQSDEKPGMSNYEFFLTIFGDRDQGDSIHGVTERYTPWQWYREEYVEYTISNFRWDPWNHYLWFSVKAVLWYQYTEYYPTEPFIERERIYEDYFSFWGNRRYEELLFNFGPDDYPKPGGPGFYWALQPGSSLLRFFRWETDNVKTLGELTRDATNSIRAVNINSIAYGKDLLEIGTTAKQLSSLLKGGIDLASGGELSKVIKTASGIYLAVHYGAKLTIKDTEEIADAIDHADFEHDYQTCGANSTVTFDYPGRDDCIVSCEQRFTGYVQSFSKEQLYFLDKGKHALRALYEYDIVPSLSNIWDMIPYSFVIDWLSPFGSALERLEDRHYAQTLPFVKCFYSRKWKWSYRDVFVSEDGADYDVTLNFKVYERSCSKDCITPPLRVSHPLQGLPSHWLEASALILAH